MADAYSYKKKRNAMITVSILGIKFLEWIWNFAVYACNITQQKIH